MTYLVGEPIFQPWKRDGFMAPAGQARLCAQVLGETTDRERILLSFRREYEAIISALQGMNIPFHIAYAHARLVDQPALARCVELGCKFARFGERFFPPAVAFPRDFSTLLPDLMLVHEQARPMVERTDGMTLLSSPFGEGGRALFHDHRMIVCERLCYPDQPESRPVGESDLDPIRAHGISVETCFAPLVRRITATETTGELALNDHIDRVAALIADPNGRLHLVLDPGIQTGHQRGVDARSWEVEDYDGTAGAIRDKLAAMKITVHRAPTLAVPYALNLLQVPDGRILMTSGDPSLRRFLEELVGTGRVVTTNVPIRYIPTWMYGGIRCLVSEEPRPVMGPVR